MAKATFEPQPEGEDVFTVKASRRAGKRTIKTPVYKEELPGIRRIQKWKTTEQKGTTIPLSGPDRRVFDEDYSDTEAPRVEQAQRHFQENLNTRLASETSRLSGKTDKDSVVTREKYESYDGEWTPRSETREQTAERILKGGADLSRRYRLPGEQRMPGAGWYFNQNRTLHAGLTSDSREEKNRLITSSGSMSPLNSPETESEAAIELNRAHRTGARVHVSEGANAWLSAQFSGTPDKPQDPEPYLRTIGESPRPITDGPVDVNDLHPDTVSMLSRRERRDAYPEVDQHSEVDFDKVAKGGANVDKGVRGTRGVSSDELSPPTTAPKVNNYTMNIRVHEGSPALESNYRTRVNNTARLTSNSPVWDGPAQGVQEDRTLTLSPGLVRHLQNQLGHGTDSYEPEDRAVRELALNAGRKVHVDNLHPRLVEALAHPDNKHARSRNLALTSSQMPTTQDSWVNAAMVGQNPEGLGYKDSGSENLGYWKKQENVGGPITDVPNTSLRRAKEGRANIREIDIAAHQHAAQDKTIRIAAGIASNRTGRVVPSVGIQESHAWTLPRRAANADADYNARKGQQFKDVP